MQITYRSQNYKASDVEKKYIAFNVQGYLKLYEVNAAGGTILEAIVSQVDYPADKVAKAKELQGRMFNQVQL